MRARSLVLVLLGAAFAGACSDVIGVDDWNNPLAGAGAGGRAPTSVTIGAGGYPACDACASMKCADVFSACDGDAQCASYKPCVGELAICCQEGGQGRADPASQALYDCLASSCLVECDMNASCSDCFLSGLETDVDCGGDSCGPCAVGKRCNDDADCASARCGADKLCF